MRAYLQLMVAGMAGQGGMVALHIQLELSGETVLVQEAHGGGHIPIILVLGGLLHTGTQPLRLLRPAPSQSEGQQPQQAAGAARGATGCFGSFWLCRKTSDDPAAARLVRCEAW